MRIRKLASHEPPPMDLLLGADPSKQMIEEYISRGDCFIAEKENNVLGVCVLVPTRPHTAELVNVAVLEREQGKGIGKQLVTEAVRRAGAAGYKTIETGTGNSSIGPLFLYQKCGFRITGVDRDFFTRNYTEAIFENGLQCRDMVRLSQDLE